MWLPLMIHPTTKPSSLFQIQKSKGKFFFGEFQSIVFKSLKERSLFLQKLLHALHVRTTIDTSFVFKSNLYLDIAFIYLLKHVQLRHMLYVVTINSLYNLSVCKSKYFNRSSCTFINGTFITEIVANTRSAFSISCPVLTRQTIDTYIDERFLLICRHILHQSLYQTLYLEVSVLANQYTKHEINVLM